MKTKKLIMLILTISFISACYANNCNRPAPCHAEKKPIVENVLKRLNEKAASLKTYQAKIQWTHTQPLFETVTIRKGNLYYIKDPNNSKLRINFKTLQTDDSKEQKHREDFLFDSVWLMRTDYQNKTISHNQLASANAPVEPFEMVSRYFPILGFSGTEDLKEQFTIEYIKPEKKAYESSAQLRLTPRPDSRYKHDYTQIDFWIADKTNLPVKIVANSNETDIFKISFSDIKINKKLKSSIFKVAKPFGFSENRTVLQQK